MKSNTRSALSDLSNSKNNITFNSKIYNQIILNSNVKYSPSNHKTFLNETPYNKEILDSSYKTPNLKNLVEKEKEVKTEFFEKDAEKGERFGDSYEIGNVIIYLKRNLFLLLKSFMPEKMKEACEMIDEFVKNETNVFDRKEFFSSFLQTYFIDGDQSDQNLDEFYETEKEELFKLLGPYDFL